MQAKPSIPNYDLIRPIGRGGFGEVWIGRAVTQSYRAIKIVRPGGSIGSRGLEVEFEGVVRYEKVVSDCPALIGVETVGRLADQEGFYYVMPLADDASSDRDLDPGGDLSGYKPLTLDGKISRDGALGIDQALELVAQVADGLAALHDVGLCHRDVKSANIVFVHGKAVLADIGLLGIHGEDDVGAGTPGFAVPEDEEAGVAAADFYSLGRVLYHAASGADPFLEFPVFPVDAIRADPSGFRRLSRIIDLCCHPEPSRRFNSAQELADACRKATSENVAAIGKKRCIAGCAVAAFVLWLGSLAWPTVEEESRPVGRRMIPQSISVKDSTYLVEGVGGVFPWRGTVSGVIKNGKTKPRRPILADLDDDGVREILLAYQSPSRRGHILALRADRRVYWDTDISPEVDNYPNDSFEAVFDVQGVHVEDLDGDRYPEVVVECVNSQGWFPGAIAVLDHQGSLRSFLFHPGNIQDHVLVVPASPQSPARILARAISNSRIINDRVPPLSPEIAAFVGLTDQELRRANERHVRCAFGVDPLVRGFGEAPPYTGEIGTDNGMVAWYRVASPRPSPMRRFEVTDNDDDGVQELAVGVGSAELTGAHDIFYLDPIDGRILGRGVGDLHQFDSELFEFEELMKE